MKTEMNQAPGVLVRCFLAVCGLLVLAGCDGGSDSGGTGAAPGSDIPPRNIWRASGDLNQPANAIDGSPSTAAVSAPGTVNAHLLLDLGRPAIFNRIVIEQGDEYGFPQKLAVWTSLDGQNYTLQAEVPGKRRVTNVSLVGPVLARYIRLQAVVPGEKPWSIAEIVLQ